MNEKQCLNYLKKNNFENRLDYLKKKYKNKSILIYGCGLLFETIAKTYDLSCLNIVAICDKKCSPKNTIKLNDIEYKVILPEEITKHKFDCVLVGTLYSRSITKQLKQDYKIKNIEPFVKNKKEGLISTLITRIKKTVNKDWYNRNLFYLIDSNNNKKSYPKISGLDVKFIGKNSKVIIYGNPLPKFKNVKIICENNSKIQIKSSKHLIQNTNFYLYGKNSEILIDENFSMNGGNMLLNDDAINKKIVIGKDCMFGWDIHIRTSDGHTVYDIETKKRINIPQDIIIGNHVWIAAKSFILKNTTLLDNTIVGACSLVNKKFDEENILIAGNPAKIKKREVNWDRKTDYHDSTF